MSEERVKRKLSAILSADVVGYSRLMGEDEVSTVRTLEAYSKTMCDLIEQFRGRVVDSPGDNLLSEFASVVDAVQCAVEIHEGVIPSRAGFVDEAGRHALARAGLPQDQHARVRVVGQELQGGEHVLGEAGPPLVRPAR